MNGPLRIVIGIVVGTVIGLAVVFLGRSLHLPMIARGALIGALAGVVISLIPHKKA